MLPAAFNDWLRDAHRACVVMGVLNVTPDSFSDGGHFVVTQKAIDHARQMIDDGADIIDIGGESTRPGAVRISSDEQLRRVMPVIDGLKKCNVTISIDTTSASVAMQAADAGATMVNDVSAGLEDPHMATVVARHKTAVALMHMQGSPGTMQKSPHYENVTDEVAAHLHNRAAVFEQAGVARDKIMVDPGIGFGKSVAHNLQLLHQLQQFKSIGYPLLVGTSRKSFIGTVLQQPDLSARLMGTAATVAWSVMHGADIVRVHDVAAMRDVVKMIQAIALHTCNS
jgi:dihydropteroate synthase